MPVDCCHDAMVLALPLPPAAEQGPLEWRGADTEPSDAFVDVLAAMLADVTTVQE